MEFWVINEKRGISINGIDEIKEMMSKIRSDYLIKIGYDVHLGFNFPDNSALREILEALSGRQAIIEMIAIDEREQSSRHPFSPTQVYCEIGGEVIRRRIANSKSIFLSQLKCDRKKIVECYKKLGFGNEIMELINKIEVAPAEESLGDFLVKIHCEILKKQFEGLNNVLVVSPQYDRWNCETGRVHEPAAHANHDVLYIPLHKEQYERIALKFRDARATGVLGEKPKYIILPVSLPTYFRKGGDE